MNFELSEEQKLLRDSVERFSRDHYEFPRWRARVASGEGFDRGLWAAMAELGWLTLTVPEAEGGYGGSALDTMLVMEGVGRALMLEPYVGAGVIAPALLPHLAAGRGPGLLKRIMAGGAVLALADAEPRGRYVASAVATTAQWRDGAYVLTGLKSHALDGAVADLFVIPARTAGAVGDEAGISLFLVEKSAPGLGVQGFRAMDYRQNAALTLDAVRVGEDALIGPIGEGFALLREALDLVIVARLAEALGAMEAAFAQTLEYLKSRRQFGQAIGGFQALQHRAVDMAIACEEARSMTYLATLSLKADPLERARRIAAAKVRVGQTSLYVARQAVQLHGGIGFSDELAIGHYLKRLTMIDLAFGDVTHHRRAFARSA